MRVGAAERSDDLSSDAVGLALIAIICRADTKFRLNEHLLNGAVADDRGERASA